MSQLDVSLRNWTRLRCIARIALIGLLALTGIGTSFARPQLSELYTSFIIG